MEYTFSLPPLCKVSQEINRHHKDTESVSTLNFQNSQKYELYIMNHFVPHRERSVHLSIPVSECCTGKQ